MTALSPHPVPARATRFRARRSRLLAGCALGGTLLLACQAERAAAQAINATPGLQAGSVTFSRNTTPTPGSETVTVNSDTAIVSWTVGTPPPGPINFLPTGNTVTFSGTDNFIILNRVFNSGGNPIQFNGRVESQVNGAVGGTVLFQNSGGIILGSTAVFDVGNLVLTTLPVAENGYGDFINEDGGFDFDFTGSNGVIDIQAGAQINALTDGSYVAMVAPRIVQGGSVRVNGSAAYIGASAATFTINDGLFDIEIVAGSPQAVPIEHTGSTTGDASTTSPRRIYMVTAPLDFGGPASPVAILLAGTAGFGDATSASVENGQIVLSAGFNIENGALGTEAKYAEANILITGGTFTSDVFGRATGTAIAETTNNPDLGAIGSGLSFEGDLVLEAFEEARLSAIDHPVTVGGNVSLTAFGALEFEEGYGSLGVQALDVTGGDVSITAENGFSVTVAGNALLDASAVGQFEDIDGVQDPTAGFGRGGTVSLETFGGSILIDGNVDMRASGRGASEVGRLPEVGGDGFGGRAEIDVDGGQIRIDGRLDIDVSGTGSVSSGVNNPNGPVGASGNGGAIDIFAFDGTITVAGGGSLNASGTGGALESSDVEGEGGFGGGGFVQIQASTDSLTGFGTTMTVNLSGTGGAGPNGGAGEGGDMTVRAFDNGFAGLANSFTVNADGFGGAGAIGDGGRGDGGEIEIVPSFGQPGATGQPARVDGGTVILTADGTGGSGVQTGGVGDGGFITVVAESDGGAISIGNISASANGTGGDGAVGGLGDGGNIVLGTEEGYGASAFAGGNDGGIGTLASTGPAVATFGAVTLNADGTGGDGTTQAGNGLGGSVVLKADIGQVNYLGGSLLSAVGRGGNATAAAGGQGTGGFVQIVAQTDTLITGSVPATELDASGFGGDGTTGGTGSGGSAFVSASGGEIDLNGGGITARAAGTGGDGTAGAGGVGQGGVAQIRASGDGILSAGDVLLNVDGTGGNGTGAGAGGLGSGGSIFVQAQSGNAILTLGNVTAQARGTGGTGGVFGDGGVGDGGNITVNIQEFGYGTLPPSAAVVEFTGLNASAEGRGGAAGAGDGFLNTPDGGVGQGGIVFVEAYNGTVRAIGAAPTVTLNANGVGGGSATGFAGNGTGGEATLRAREVGLVSTSGGTVSITVVGVGGDGSRGGLGLGGSAFAGASTPLVGAVAGEMDLDGNIALDASGIGGDSDGFAADVSGTGGLARIAAFRGGEVSFVRADVTADGRGGNGVIGGTGRAGNSVDPATSVQTGAFISAQDGRITGDSGNVSAQGFGGNGTGSDGGDGFGGTAQIVALNSTGPSVVDLGSGNINISAAGGDGATSYSGGDATAGITGVAIAETLNGNSLTIDNLVATADATGGDAGDAVDSLIGNGGNATAGFIQIGTSSGFGSGTVGGSATFGTIQASASAVGGNGVAAGSDGGSGAGGALSLLARGGQLTTGIVTFTANGTGGTAGAGGTGGAGTGGEAAALFTPRFQTSSAPVVTIAGLNFTADGQGGAAAGNGTGGAATGGVVFVGTQESGYGSLGGSASLGGLDFSASADGGDGGGRGGDGTGGSITLLAQGAPITFTTATMVADGTGGSSTTPAGAPGLGSGGVISLLALNPAGTITGTSLQGAAGGFGGSASGNSAGRWEVTVSDSDITINDVQLDAGVQGTSVGGQTSRIDLLDGTFTATTRGSFFAVGQTQVNAEGTGVLAGDDLLFRGTALEVNHSGRPAGAFTIDAGQVFTAQVGTDFVANQGTLVRADGQINIEPDGVAVIGGVVEGADIAIRSSDIEIADTGFVGRQDTDRIDLAVIPSFGQSQPNPVVIGGDEEGPGYTLDADEIGRLRGRELNIEIPAIGTVPDRDPDAVIRDVTIRPGTGSSGAGLNVFQVTMAAGEGGGGGILSVEGDLRFENAGAEDGIVLIAPGRLQVVNPEGSIRVLGANGLPGGTLGIESANIWSASQTIIDQLIDDPNFAGRNEALLQNGGTVAERGYIEGGEILLRVGDTLFVQNSGTADAFAGITVVQNTLTIQPTSSDPIDVYAFGRRINADGTFVTNSPYFREVEFGYGSGYLETAQFNLCVIATGACPDDPEPPELSPEIPIGNEVIEGPIEETEENVPPPNPDRQEFVDVSFASESLLEEPVTSGGDSSIWDEDCEPGEAGAACRAAQPGDGGN